MALRFFEYLLLVIFVTGYYKFFMLYKEETTKMAISRVWIEDGCISCGLAEDICPQVFKLSDNTSNTVIEGADLSSYEAEIKEAAENCPVGVIMYEDVSLGEGEVSG